MISLRKKLIRLPLNTFLLLFILGSPAVDSRPTVLELYTAQGCIICSDANSYLHELIHRQDSENLLILSFHVDYWDYLGWKDTFAKPEMTNRQKGYAHSLEINFLSTPQFIIDGYYDVVGLDRNRVESLISRQRKEILKGPNSMWFEIQEDGLYLKVDRGNFDKIADVWLISYIPKQEVEITGGDNKGLNVVYKNVAYRIDYLGEWSGEYTEYSVQENIDSIRGVELGWAALIQTKNYGKIIGATRTESSIIRP